MKRFWNDLLSAIDLRDKEQVTIMVSSQDYEVVADMADINYDGFTTQEDLMQLLSEIPHDINGSPLLRGKIFAIAKALLRWTQPTEDEQVSLKVNSLSRLYDFNSLPHTLTFQI